MRVAPLAVALLAVACGGQKVINEDANWTKDDSVQGGAFREAESLFSAEESDADRFTYTLRGVRHDLTLAAGGELTRRCNCVDVVVSRPEDGRFKWEGEKPSVAPEEEVFAFRTEGAHCPPGTPAVRRPSIRAIDSEGPHTYVVIEELPLDRPQALGAIVRRPRPGGSLFVKPRDVRLYREDRGQELPYGRTGSPNEPFCRVYTRGSGRIVGTSDD